MQGSMESGLTRERDLYPRVPESSYPRVVMSPITRLACCCPLVLAFACGGNCPEAKTPDDEPPPTTSAMSEEPLDDETSESQAEESEDETTEDEAADEAPPKAAEPDFPPNASVDEAIAAVPQGSERLNLDNETLAKPLQNPDLYEPCNPGSQHFTLKIAVWNGRAVGVDVKTKNQKLAECLAGRIREIEWDDKVPSLNTIEYGF
jgi:hypothetical protein